MCGILFAVNNSGIETTTKSHFKKSLNLISHRGPSSSNERIENNLLLGFNRLSIVGSKNGSQPIYNEDRSLVLLCNGEIYNYQTLKGLLKNNHSFQGKSDCEIILHLYEENGTEFVNLLRGQFAFVLIDKKNNVLLMSRDRFGIQPLFYTKNKNNTLIVASEIKSILEIDKSVSKKLDPLGIKESLFLYGPTPPRTVFENIYQVKPGHTLIYDLDSNKIIDQKKYWEIPETNNLEYEDSLKKFQKILETAVKRRFQGNKKNLSVYLSGGLDSASILALTKKLSNDSPTAFSIEFDDKKFDESRFQKIVTQHLNIKRHVINVSKDLFENLFQSVWHIEQPLIRTAPLPMFSLSQLVREHERKFVLCGEGADEMMFGYPVFQKELSSIEDKLKDYNESLFSFTKKTGKDLVKFTSDSVAKEFSVSKNSIREKQLTEITTKLSRYLLVSQGDRQSMSHSIEQRFPFLDEDLVDFLFSLPTDFLRNKQSGKLLLKTTMQELLPDIIIDRKKQGYLAPIADVLYSSPLIKEIINDLIITNWSKKYDKYFSKQRLIKLIHKYQKKILTEVEAIGLFFVISTLLLDKQFFTYYD